MTEEVQSWPTGRLLSTAARMVEHSWEALLREHDLTHAGLIALHCLLPGAMPQRGLAKACRVTDQTMSRTVERLEGAGFVDRGVDPADRRRNLVAITRTGRAVHERLVVKQQADALLADAVSDHAGLRAQLIELMASLGGPDTDVPRE